VLGSCLDRRLIGDVQPDEADVQPVRSQHLLGSKPSYFVTGTQQDRVIEFRELSRDLQANAFVRARHQSDLLRRHQLARKVLR
jgi:hypothetical protein